MLNNALLPLRPCCPAVASSPPQPPPPQALKHLAGVPDANMAVFMLGCGLLSSARLFYFGTYLPHRCAG